MKPGTLPQPPAEVWFNHADSCDKCRKYLDVCSVGNELLRKAAEA